MPTLFSRYVLVLIVRLAPWLSSIARVEAAATMTEIADGCAIATPLQCRAQLQRWLPLWRAPRPPSHAPHKDTCPCGCA